MSCTDPIADMLTIIRNGIQANKRKVDIRHSNIKAGICQVLKDEGYIDGFELLDTQPSRTIQVRLRYAQDGESVIHAIKRISTPGRRVYNGLKELHPVIGGYGISILSTSKGVLSDRVCRRENIGGEVLCEIH